MVQLWVAVVAALGTVAVAAIGAAGGWYLRKSQRGKTDAEAADILTTSAMRLVKQLEGDVEELRENVAKRDLRISALEGQVRDLEAEVEQLRADQVQDRNKIRYLSGRNTHLTRGVRILRAQMECLGVRPDWQNGGEPLPQPGEATE